MTANPPGLRSLLARPRPTSMVDLGGVPAEFRALKPKDYEALTAKHTDKDGALGDGFLPELAAACSTSDDLTPEEWATILEDNVSQGEQGQVMVQLLMLNATAPTGGLGKG